MYFRYRKLFVIFSLVGLLIGSSGCAVADLFSGIDVAPVRGLQITIDESQREELVTRLQKFAEKHGFKFQVTDPETGGKDFQVWMSRQDFIITVDHVPPDPTLVVISFYSKYSAGPLDEEVLDDLSNDLKGFIAEIPGVTISEEK